MAFKFNGTATIEAESEKAGLMDAGSGQSRAFPEPSPDWQNVHCSWQALWYFHTNAFGTLFLLVFLYAAIVLWLSRSSFSKGKFHLPSLNIMLLVMGSLRSLVLLLNPYSALMRNVKELKLVCTILTGIGGACITSAVSILLLIVLASTKTTLGPARITRLPVFLSVAAVNIIYLVVADLVVWFHPAKELMLLVCQVTFSTWGLFITVGYLITGARMRRNLSSSRQMSSFNAAFQEESKRLRRLLKLVYSCALFCMLHFTLSIYSATSHEVGVLNKDLYVKNEWKWFVLQTLARALELSMSTLMLAVTTMSMREHGHSECGKGSKHSQMKEIVKSWRNSNSTVLHERKEPTTTVVPKQSTINVHQMEKIADYWRNSNTKVLHERKEPTTTIAEIQIVKAHQMEQTAESRRSGNKTELHEIKEHTTNIQAIQREYITSV